MHKHTKNICTHGLDTMCEICNELKLLRNQIGLTQPELANILGVTKNTVYNWETNQNPPKYILYAYRYAKLIHGNE